VPYQSAQKLVVGRVKKFLSRNVNEVEMADETMAAAAVEKKHQIPLGISLLAGLGL
jgi:hypothetical protein